MPMRFKHEIWTTVLLTLSLSVAANDNKTNVERTGYMYTPAGKGIEIENGKGRFNRPLYSTVDRNRRLIALAGDRPEFMLMQISSTKRMTKLANLKLGLADGSWLEEIAPVRARYDRGLQQYWLGEKDARLEVAAVRARAFDGLLLRVKREDRSTAPLVLAVGGRGSSNYDQNPRASAFNPRECRGTKLRFADNILTLSERGATLYATGSTPLGFTSADPKEVAKGPGALLDAPVEENAVAALEVEWPKTGEFYFILTPDAPDSEGVKAFRAEPAKVFAAAVQDNQKIASAIEIDTPDPYLDAAFPSLMLGYEAAWHAPSFRHGAIRWHDPYAGWRVTYGGTVAGWHDRVQSHMHAFYGKQRKDGRIPSMLGRDHIYNMGEELVDQALYDYEWTGDLEPLKNGGFDAIAAHLAWGEKYMKTPDGLYENFLNAWNTDYKWSNGGSGTLASTYYWRANKTMAEIAERLGKDPALFQKRAETIAAAMKDRLWSEAAGVYGEYRDTRGRKLLHESPDLPSIAIPIDRGFGTAFESYRALRFALRRFEQVKDLPRDSSLIYSSEWLPNHYSTRGIYTAEIINALLALYMTGQSEAAEPLRRGVDGSFFAGPGPGSTGYIIHPDGTYKPHTDFNDTTSMYVRNVVEGLFGVQMRAPDKRVILQPSFPLAWDHAAIRCPAVEYQYKWENGEGVETMAIRTPRDLMPTIRLRARRAAIDTVTVNGEPARYEIEPGIGMAWLVIQAPLGRETQVRVGYGDEALPEVAATPKQGVVGETYTVRVDRGRIESVRQSRSTVDEVTIAGDGKSCSFTLPSEAGVATWFVRVEHGDVGLAVPVEVDVRPAHAAKEKAPAADTVELQPKPIDLSEVVNQHLAALHKNKYTPRIEPFYWARRDGMRTVQANGRIWWEARKYGLRPDTSRLKAAKGTFVVDERIPFTIPVEGDNAVFTSMYDNFPDRIDVPVNERGRKVAVLGVASISLMQSRMDNGRLRVHLDDGTHRDVVLRDPETVDDWLGSGYGKPYVLGGHPVSLGKNTHGHLYEIDLGGDRMVKSVELETFTNETMIGLLGITVLQTTE